jgi:hypothetical protein
MILKRLLSTEMALQYFRLHSEVVGEGKRVSEY